MERSTNLSIEQAERLVLCVLESNDIVAGGIIFFDFMEQWQRSSGDVEDTYKLCLAMVEKYKDDYHKDSYAGVFDE